MFTVVRLVRPVRSVGGSRTDVRRRRRSVCRAGQLDFKHKDICQRITGAGTASGSRADGPHASAGSFQSGPRQGGRGVGGRRAPLAFVWLALFVLPYTATRSAAVNRFFKLVRPCQLGCRLRHRVFNRVSRPRASWSVCYRSVLPGTGRRTPYGAWAAALCPREPIKHRARPTTDCIVVRRKPTNHATHSRCRRPVVMH